MSPKTEGGGDTNGETLGGLTLIDTSGDTPTLKIGAVVSFVVGTVFWGTIQGVITMIQRFGAGLWGSVRDLETWLAGQGGLIPAVFAIPETLFSIAFTLNASWLGVTGPFAQVLAVVEIGALVWMVLWGIQTALGQLGGA